MFLPSDPGFPCGFAHFLVRTVDMYTFLVPWPLAMSLSFVGFGIYETANKTHKNINDMYINAHTQNFLDICGYYSTAEARLKDLMSWER